MTKQSSEGQRQRLDQPVPKKQRRWLRALGMMVGAGAIFLFGWGIGSGRIHIAALSKIQSENTDLPASLDTSSVQEVYRALRDNYDSKLTVEQLLDGAKAGLAASTGDPYTEYMNAEEAQEFRDDLNGTFSGIGAELSKEGENIVVVAPIAGYPAAAAGLQSKDVIVSIDDKPTTGMSLSQAVNAIRGPAGTEVKLTVNRAGVEKEITITRATINVPSVKWEVKDEIGYMTISTFSEDTPDLAVQAAQDFKNKSVQGVVVDVRGNPGGLLDSSVSVASLWLEQGDTVLTEQRGGKVIKTYPASGNNILAGIPTVVLIDESSASASEILAGALQDNKVATLIGVTSYGKGSVQNLIDLKNGGVLKVTIARWFTPEGQNIDKSGIAPDKTVERTAADVKASKDPQKDAATQALKQ